MQIARNKINKAVGFLASKSGKQSFDYADLISVQAKIYWKLGNNEKAIKILQEAKVLYEQLGMKDSKESQGLALLDKLLEMKQMPESNLFNNL